MWLLVIRIFYGWIHLFDRWNILLLMCSMGAGIAILVVMFEIMCVCLGGEVMLEIMCVCVGGEV
jgi:hypothetical protein